MEDWIKKNEKNTFLTTPTTVIKKDPTTSIKKHVYELKVHEKTVRTAIEEDSNPDLKPLDYAIWGVLENKTNVTSYPNIGSLKTAIEEEWNKISEEFILQACISFRRPIDIIIKKPDGHNELIYCVLSLFLFCCLFFKININLVLL